MKIRSLTLKHIGVFEDETIVFPEKKEKDKAEIHILTGQNGTGKTTILQALASKMLEVKPFVEFKSLISLSFRNNFIKRWNENKEHFEKDDYGKLIFDNNAELMFKGIEIISGILFNYKNGLDEYYSEKRDIVLQTSLKEHSKNYIHNFVAFAYSGYRFIDNEEKLNIKEKEDYNPLENALEFNKTYGKNDYSLNQWLANTILKRNNAFFDGNEKEVERFKRNIENLKLIIQEIIQTPIDFKFKNETSKIVAVKEGV
jgi:predicted ATP-binding protein involved in virulence